MQVIVKSLVKRQPTGESDWAQIVSKGTRRVSTEDSHLYHGCLGRGSLSVMLGNFVLPFDALVPIVGKF